MPQENPLGDLLTSTRTAFANARRSFAAPADEIDRTLAGLENIDTGQTSANIPGGGPTDFVARHLGSGGAAHHDAHQLLQHLTMAKDDLPWRSSFYPEDGYADIPRFYDGYAYAMVVSDPRYAEDTVWVSRDVSLSFTVQAPHTLYPEHAHTAVELYYVLSGKAMWKRGSEPWVTRYPGEVILHETGMRHAMMTADEPLVACAIWISHTDAPIVIVRS